MGSLHKGQKVNCPLRRYLTFLPRFAGTMPMRSDPLLARQRSIRWFRLAGSRSSPTPVGWSVQHVRRNADSDRESDRTATSPSPTPARCARTLDHSQSCAAPHQPRPHWVQRDVANGTRQMILVHRRRNRTDLAKDGRVHPWRSLMKPGIAPVRLCQCRAQSVSVGRRQDQVNMVGHQAVCPDLRRRCCRSLSEDIAYRRGSRPVGRTPARADCRAG